MSIPRRTYVLLIVGLLAVGIFIVIRTTQRQPDAESRQRTDATPSTSSGTDVTGALRIFFSHTYRNDPEIPRRDDDNIDRHLVAFIDGSTGTLDAAIYELESERIAAALIRAMKRGVRVRIVSDTDYRDNAEMKEVIEAGIPVRFDERSALMHDKFLIADNARVWTGSYNTTDNCSYRNNNNSVQISSRDIADNFQLEFNEMFEAGEFGPRSPSRVPHNPVKVGDADIYTYFSPEDDIPPKIVRILRTARRSIHFMAFSFSDDDIATAIIEGARRGVDVEGVMETTGSKAKSSEAARFDSEGIRLFRDGNSFMMHHKVIIVDGLWTITGSYNFTASAARANDENLLIIKSGTVAGRYEEEYRRIRAMAAGAR